MRYKMLQEVQVKILFKITHMVFSSVPPLMQINARWAVLALST